MATLVYSDVDGHEHTIALGAEPITVGRAPEATIRSADPRVSRMHARFFVEGGVLWVEDTGSQNGVFVGPNRIQRAPVPTGELILVGSVMVRLLPASGTLPPPVGLHGTLGQWLSMERKTRLAVEEERDAFARRVGEIHQLLAQQPVAGDPEAVRLRDEAEARAAALERALASIQDELAATREAAGNTLDRDESAAALMTADQARLAAEKDAQGVREELDKLRKASQGELEAVRTELAKVREAKAVAETQAGMQVAEKLAEADFRIADLEAELKKAKQPAGPDPKLQQLSEQVTTLTSRAEKAEKEFMQIQIRAQGAERNLSAAQSAAAMAETRVAQAEDRAKELEAKLKMREVDAQQVRERAEELEKTVVPTMAKQAALIEQAERAGKLEREFAEVTQAFETRSGRIVELEAEVTKLRDRVVQAEDLASGSTATAEIAKGEAAEAKALVADAERRVTEMKSRLDAAGGHESAIAVANKAKDDAVSRALSSDQRAEDAEHRADDAEKRAAAADTMQKAMAKDVAEALRRAAEADSKAKAQIRELSETRTKGEELDKRLAELDATRIAADERASKLDAELAKLKAELARAEGERAQQVADAQRDAATRTETHQRELRTRVEETQRDLTATHETAVRALSATHETALRDATSATEAKLKDVQQKLEQLGRELAAERQSSLALVETKTNLEHQLAEAEELAQRTEAAESRVVELEVQLEQLTEKIEDLESNVAIAETARQAGIDEERGKASELQNKLRDTEHLVKAAGEELATVQARAHELEAKLASAETAKTEAGEALATARTQLAEALASAQEHRGNREAEQDKLDDALARANEAERKADGLARSAEAADLAIGRAGALQRQLDEAITKLSYLERDGAKNNNAAEREELAEKLAQAESNAQKAQEKVRESSAKLEGLRELDARANAAEQKIGELEKLLGDAERRAAAAEQRAAASDQRATSTEQRAATAEQRATATEQKIAATEQRAVAAEQRAIAAEADAASAGVTGEELEEARARITELEDELQKADNVRSFAAETEREIAGLQRELREAKSSLSRVTLERDRFESELADSREDDETRDRAMPPPDLGKLPALMARVAELEKQNQAAQREVSTLQQQLADAEDKAESTTTTGSQLPLQSMVEQVSILEESIDSLRSNMRAASDETAMMDQSESVVIVSSAVSQAAEHIERARVAVKVLVKSLNH